MAHEDPYAQTIPWTVPQKLFGEALADFAQTAGARAYTEPFFGSREPGCFHICLERIEDPWGWDIAVSERGQVILPPKAPGWVLRLIREARREAKERLAMRSEAV
jgi:hypothetical protein